MKQFIILLQDVWDSLRDTGILILWLLAMAIPIWIILGIGLFILNWAIN